MIALSTGSLYTYGVARVFELAAEVKNLIPEAHISVGPGPLDNLYQRGPFDISRIKTLGYQLEFSLTRGLTEFIKTLEKAK